MREIKFRAWLSDTKNKINSRMIYSDELGIIKFFENFYSWTGNIKRIMQYTGLKDRHGKEIYEGDIVKGIDKHSGYNVEGVVRFYNDCFLVMKYFDEDFGYPLAFESLMDIEVIGNIYENSELSEEVTKK